MKAQTDLASWESYKALSLSSIKGTINIPLDGILFVPDYKSIFTEEVVSVELKDGNLIAEQKQTEITNDIWDGESLLDESVFESGYADKHMLLLRNKFFKSCAFRTKLQKWIKDKNITLDDIKKRGFTLATDVSQIVIVTKPNSLKYLKFAGGLSEKNIRKWIESVDNTFGVVKWDKGTRFFHGDMVQSSYQLLNTLGFDKAQAEELLKPSFDYISLVRNDVEFMRYHFTDAYVREKDGEEEPAKKVEDFLLSKMDFTEHYVDREVIKQFVHTIVPVTETCFHWYMNFDLIDVPNDMKKLVWEFTIDYKSARSYRKEKDGMLRPNQWQDLTVKVFI